MSLIFATQLGAIATAVLAVFAIVTAWYARKAFRAQAKEVGILQQQNEREAIERRRTQAARVFIGAPHETRGGVTVRPYAMNASDLPVYDAQLWYLNDHGHYARDGDDDLGTIRPGGKVSAVIKEFTYHDAALAHTALTFRDAAGVRWMRMPRGDLEEQSGATAEDSVLAMFGNPPVDSRNR
jgi:hypothetical protein